MVQQPPVSQDLHIIEASWHTRSRYDSSGRVISPKQTPLPDNTQHSKQIKVCDPNPHPLGDSNPQSQQASGRRPTP